MALVAKQIVSTTYAGSAVTAFGMDVSTKNIDTSEVCFPEETADGSSIDTAL